MENNELVKAINRFSAAFETFNKLYAHVNEQCKIKKEIVL